MGSDHKGGGEDETAKLANGKELAETVEPLKSRAHPIPHPEVPA